MNQSALTIIKFESMVKQLDATPNYYSYRLDGRDRDGWWDKAGKTVTFSEDDQGAKRVQN